KSSPKHTLALPTHKRKDWTIVIRCFLTADELSNKKIVRRGETQKGMLMMRITYFSVFRRIKQGQVVLGAHPIAYKSTTAKQKKQLLSSFFVGEST
ncbi:MAG: hypothetical protein J6S89_11445, partial [Paludibacteraceae bacterium]|nr:hypothetical protein [Paludibacteraceae bacterium]